MPVTSVEKDTEALTMTIVADFPVPVSRLWDAYVDPRQIEKFWGPETYPATFLRHDVFPGGRSIYFMTGPGGGIAPAATGSSSRWIPGSPSRSATGSRAPRANRTRRCRACA